MLKKYFVKLRMTALIAGASLLFLTACDSSTSNVAPTATSSTTNAASAIIKHTPSGTVTLTWDASSHALTTHLSLTGLAPKSTHPSQIRSGSCRSGGKVTYALTDVKGSQLGFADAITTIKNVLDGIPSSGWYILVQNGPGSSVDAESLPITCADVSKANVSTKTSQTVQVTLIDVNAADQSVNGSAKLALNNKQLTVVINVKGLAPNSKHDAHIHQGSCSSQGAVVHELKPVVANAAGDGNSTTIIPGVDGIPLSGWYVNIHRTTDMSTQAGYDPVACGDFTVGP